MKQVEVFGGRGFGLVWVCRAMTIFKPLGTRVPLKSTRTRATVTGSQQQNQFILFHPGHKRTLKRHTRTPDWKPQNPFILLEQIETSAHL